MEPATPISRDQVDQQLAKLNAELDSQKNSSAAQQPATLVDTAMQVGLLPNPNPKRTLSIVQHQNVILQINHMRGTMKARWSGSRGGGILRHVDILCICCCPLTPVCR